MSEGKVEYISYRIPPEIAGRKIHICSRCGEAVPVVEITAPQSQARIVNLDKVEWADERDERT